MRTARQSRERPPVWLPTGGRRANRNFKGGLRDKSTEGWDKDGETGEKTTGRRGEAHAVSRAKEASRLQVPFFLPVPSSPVVFSPSLLRSVDRLVEDFEGHVYVLAREDERR